MDAYQIVKLAIISLTISFSTAQAEEVDPIQSMIASISEWAPTCEGSISKESCEDEDSALWNGMMCSVDTDRYSKACDAMRASQGADGRVWRSPRRVGIETNNSFSRTMALGVLFYLVATKDQGFAVDWMNYIRKQGGLCPDGVFSSCAINGRLPDAIRDVYRHLGLESYLPLFISETPTDTLGWVFEAQTTAVGEPLHYVGLQLLIRKQLGEWTGEMQSAARALNHRQTQNLFFVWLNGGKTHTFCNRVLGLAPVTKPSSRTNWTWQRADMEKAWRQSMGWDFIYLGEACK